LSDHERFSSPISNKLLFISKIAGVSGLNRYFTVGRIGNRSNIRLAAGIIRCPCGSNTSGTIASRSASDNFPTMAIQVRPTAGRAPFKCEQIARLSGQRFGLEQFPRAVLECFALEHEKSREIHCEAARRRGHTFLPTQTPCRRCRQACSVSRAQFLQNRSRRFESEIVLFVRLFSGCVNLKVRFLELVCPQYAARVLASLSRFERMQRSKRSP